jgi:hypothetical protein
VKHRTTSGRRLLVSAAVAAGLLVSCARRESATYQVLVRVESDPGKPLPGARVAIQGREQGVSDGDGVVALQLAGAPGEVVVVDTTCPSEYRPPKAPLSIVLRRTTEDRQPEFRVSCPPLKRTMVLAVRAQNGADLPVRYLGKEIARTDRGGTAHALLAVDPGETVTFMLDTGAPEHAQLMPQNPELKVVIPERDEIVILDQSFKVPAAPPKKRHVVRQPSGPQKIVRASR